VAGAIRKIRIDDDDVRTIVAELLEAIGHRTRPSDLVALIAERFDNGVPAGVVVDQEQMRHAQEPVYHSVVGTLRTSEEGAIAAGEGRKAQSADEDRRVDEAPKIIISAGPVATAEPVVQAPAPVVPRRSATLPTAPEKQGGLGLVIVLYVLAAAALGYAIYERYFT
jgi:hypothetical protein